MIFFCNKKIQKQGPWEWMWKCLKEIDFEFTSQGTSQKNGAVEIGFYTLYSWKHGMMVHEVPHKN